VHNILPFYKDYENGVDSITSREIYCQGTIDIECEFLPGDSSSTDVYSQN